MSFSGLNIAGSALTAFQAAENVISNNITNVDTPGASQQTPLMTQATAITANPDFGTQVNPGTIGQGVTVQSIQRIHDNALDALYRGAYSSQNYYSQLSAGLTTFQQALNEPTGGISNAMENFQTAVSQLASVNTNASNAAANRANVVQSAQAVTSELNSAGNQISILETNAQTTATNLVSTVNGILDHIATLNGEIRAGTAAGESPNTYLDQRDQLVDELSQYVPTTTVNEVNGSTLITVNGRAVVDDTVVYHLDLPLVVKGITGIPTMEISLVNDPNPINPTPLIINSGQLGGVLDLYNTGLATYGAQLDGYANAIAQKFNTINASGFDQNGQQGATFFTSPGGIAAITAANITVGLSSPSQIAMASATTKAGGLTKSMNTSTTSVDTSSLINLATAPNIGDTAFNNPAPTGGLIGTIAVNVDGVTKTLSYNTLTTDTTLGTFMTRFNALQAGVTASFDPTSESLVFARDPSNESLAFQSTTGYSPTASFTITDTPSGGALVAGSQPAAGTNASSLLQVFGAGGMSGITQNVSNAFSSSDNSNAAQMQNIFTNPVGVPPVSTTATAAIAAGTQTVVPVGGLGNIIAGTVLTIGAGTATQENVTVTSVDSTATPPTLTATFSSAHAAGATIQAALVQTLSSYYGNFIATVGFNGSAANSGLTTQTNLTNGIQTRRQGVDGINLDQETQKLIMYQMAYQAAAKTFSTLESMLNSVITQLIP